MSLDGAFLHTLKREIEETALGARIDRINQPSRDELVFVLRHAGGNLRLLLSANAGSARIHFTADRPENPASPPMFCMLLRKRLGNARLSAVRQAGLERALHLDFDTTNELGDAVTLTVAAEIMGRHSNIIVIDRDGRVIDSIKRVSEEISGVRQILPGIRYEPPPSQPGKRSLLETPSEALVEAIASGADRELSKGVLEYLQGLSPIVCREAAHYAAWGMNITSGAMSEDIKSRLAFYFDLLREAVLGASTPIMVCESDGKPLDFTFVSVTQYGLSAVTRTYPGPSALMDAFYSQRSLRDRMKQRSDDLLKLLVILSDRLRRKLAVQRQELAQSGQREYLKIYGDLLTSNLHTLDKGAASVTLSNYYDENGTMVIIPLNTRLTPAQNAQHYYVEYRKADTTERKLKELIVQGEDELAYLETVFDHLTRADTEAELVALREELAEQGYVRNRGSKNKKVQRLAPISYISPDGFTILAGRNNLQNDQLTLRQAAKGDVWFHTQRIPGSHVVVLGDGQEVPDTTLEAAAVIAAYNSKARGSSGVPVDYTSIRHVKKPNGAKPGMVIYDHYRTAYVTPNEEFVRSMLARQ